MLIQRRSQLTGKTSTMDINVDRSRLLKYMMEGGHIQNHFPDLKPEEREFIRTGITPQEWEEYIGKLDDE
jgi:hypothetical protein